MTYKVMQFSELLRQKSKTFKRSDVTELNLAQTTLFCLRDTFFFKVEITDQLVFQNAFLESLAEKLSLNEGTGGSA